MNKKALSIGLITAGIIATGGLLANIPSAKASENFGPQSLIQRLVEKFNLNQEEVELVFTQEHEQRMQQGRERSQEHLNQLVIDGVITAEQKDVLIAKREEMRTSDVGNKDLTPEERKAMREQHRSEMESWAEENEIELDQLHQNNPPGKMGNFGKRF